MPEAFMRRRPSRSVHEDAHRAVVGTAWVTRSSARFQNTAFFNQRKLRVPLGAVRLQRVLSQ
jgi:hypothetical protein